jgi:hypothetical protein
MARDEKVRFCSGSDRNVYNFLAVTDAEIQKLIAQQEGEPHSAQRR